MGKSGGSAPSPDPQIGRAALKQAQTGEQWLSFAKDAFVVSNERQKEIDALTTKVTTQQLNTATEQAGWASADRKRYEDVFRPIEDQFVEEAANYDTPEKQAAAAATAKADIMSASAGQKQQAEREAAAVGISPASGRGLGITRAADLGTTLASAGAQNNARQQVKDKALALKADVVNLGKGLPTQSAQAASLGLSAGSQAAGNINAANASYQGSLGIMGQGYQGAMAGYQGQANTLQNQYNSQLQAWGMQQQQNASAASGIGSILGLGLSFVSSKKKKTDKKKVADGKALDAVKKMPVEEWTYKPGEGDGGRHIGTYAEDMQKQTGLGDGQTIGIQDAIGVTMRAVQDLSKQVDALSKQVGLGRPAPAKNNRPAPKPEPMRKAA